MPRADRSLGPNDAPRGLALAFVALLGLVLLITGHADAQTNSDGRAAVRESLAPAAGMDEGYQLGTGDKLRIIVFGEADLGGDYVVDGSGYVQMPLIGQVGAAGRTIHDFEAAVSAKLADGYLKDPRVSVEVTNYRPFYILGEVKSPGKYSYVTGMTVLNAVAMAGGFTDRADDSDVYIRHGGSSKEKEVSVNGTVKVSPGDIIRVKERFF